MQQDKQLIKRAKKDFAQRILEKYPLEVKLYGISKAWHNNTQIIKLQ